jgi:hypothetical protein
MVETSFRAWAVLREVAGRRGGDDAHKCRGDRLELPPIYWTKWKKCDETPEHAKPAVYQFRLAKNGKAVPIQRMLGIDREGVILIGATSSMDERHEQHNRARQSGDGSSPMSLLYYFENHTKLRRRFPGSCYEYRFAKLTGEEEAKMIESKLIKAYAREYADRPLLNCEFPDRHCGWDV